MQQVQVHDYKRVGKCIQGEDGASKRKQKGKPVDDLKGIYGG